MKIAKVVYHEDNVSVFIYKMIMSGDRYIEVVRCLGDYTWSDKLHNFTWDKEVENAVATFEQTHKYYTTAFEEYGYYCYKKQPTWSLLEEMVK